MCARPQTKLVALLLLTLVGCNQSRTLTGQVPGAGGWQPAPSGGAPYTAQQDVDRRMSSLDADNRDLHSELARSQQQVRLLKDEIGLLREQLASTANQLRDLQVAKQGIEKEMETYQTSALRGGGATLKANNSLKDSLTLVQIPGAEVRQDGDVIRIAIPADQLFRYETSQLIPSGYSLLDQVATAITRAYSKQIIGIEGYTDTSAVDTASAHQLTSGQAVAVLDVLTRRNRIPEKQLLTVGHGSNHPIASNATPAGRAKNRRIELVIYPETVGD